jgi:Ca2+-binding EF-hand superfamily protein
MGSGLTGFTGGIGSPESMSSKQAETYLAQAFKFFDHDDTGFITKENIKKLMS